MTGSFAVTRILRSHLVGTSLTALTVRGGTAALAVITLAASLLSTRRATTIDPVVALRAE